MTGPAVLNTRPTEHARELSQLLRQAGFEPIELPVVEIERAWRAAEMRTIGTLLNSQRYTWLALQSQNAWRFLVDGLTAVGFPLTAPLAVSVLCGQSTARALDLHVIRRAALHALTPFSSLRALQAARGLMDETDRVLLPRAADGRDDLRVGLERLGIPVDSPVCYATLPVPPERLERISDLVSAGTVQAITVCSPSAVTAIAAAIPADRLSRVALVCLGQTTAAAARAANLRVDRVSQATSMSDLVRAVQSALAVAA